MIYEKQQIINQKKEIKIINHQKKYTSNQNN